MTDVFGNYIVQKLFEYGTLVQKKLLAAEMKGHVAELATNIYGCRCVQEVSKPPNTAICRPSLT